MERRFSSVLDVDQALASRERQRVQTRSPVLREKLDSEIEALRQERGKLERDGEGVPVGARAQEDAHELAARVCKAFVNKAFRVHDEATLQRAVAGLFLGAGIEFEEQVILGPGERIDFMIGSVGVELKTKGSWSDLVRQLDRYAAHERVGALVVVSTRRHLIVSLPQDVRGKPLLAVGAGAL